MLSLKLFPTDVYIQETKKIDNEKISKIILEKEKTELSQNVSNVGAWQSERNLHTDERFLEILKEVDLCFQETIHEQTNYKSGYIVIGEMWANVNRYRDSNIHHTHGNNEWSFVYYVKIPEDSGNLVLIDPRVRRPNSGIKGLIKNHNNSFTHDSFVVAATIGNLILFPGWLEHYVQSNASKQPRISISGNVEMRQKHE